MSIIHWTSPLIPDSQQLVEQAIEAADLPGLTLLAQVGLLVGRNRDHALRRLLTPGAWNPGVFDRLMHLEGAPTDWKRIFALTRPETPAACLECWMARGLDPSAPFACGLTPLRMAISSQASQLVRALVAAGVCPDERDAYGRTPLMNALKTETPPSLPALLFELGADPNATDKGGISVLGHAVLGDANCIPELMRLGAQAKRPCGGRPDALLFAAHELRDQAFGLLRKRVGRGPLLRDLSWLDTPAVRRLVFSAHRVHPDEHALDAELAKGDPRRLVRRLLVDTPARKAMAWAHSARGSSHEHFDGRYEYVVYSSNALLPKAACTDALRFLMHCAFQTAENLRRLIANLPAYPGERLDWLNTAGSPTRFNACFSRHKPADSYASPSDQPRVSLLNLGLHVAVRYANASVLPVLKNEGADFSSRYRDGQTLSDGAPDFPTLKGLLELGARPDMTGGGDSPYTGALQAAIERDDADAVRLLMATGVPPRVRQCGLRLPALHFAARQGKPRAFFALIHSGAESAAITPEDYCDALVAEACSGAQAEILAYLTKNGADLLQKDRAGYPAWWRLLNQRTPSIYDSRLAAASMLRALKGVVRSGALPATALRDPFRPRFQHLLKSDPEFPHRCMLAFVAQWHFAWDEKAARRYAFNVHPQDMISLGFGDWLAANSSHLPQLLRRGNPPTALHLHLESLSFSPETWDRLVSMPEIVNRYVENFLNNPSLPENLRSVLLIASANTQSDRPIF